jgi:hypothetical protein
VARGGLHDTREGAARAGGDRRDGAREPRPAAADDALDDAGRGGDDEHPQLVALGPAGAVVVARDKRQVRRHSLLEGHDAGAQLRAAQAGARPA